MKVSHGPYLCRKCGNEFEPSESAIRKGDFICRPCEREYERNWREQRRAKGLSTGGGKVNPERQKEYKKSYYKRPEVRQRKAELARIRRADPAQQHKIIARLATRRAIERGDLVRMPCEVCGAVRVDAHHDDYSNPLQVRWLCRPHHHQHHLKEALAKGESA